MLGYRSAELDAFLFRSLLIDNAGEELVVDGGIGEPYR